MCSHSSSYSNATIEQELLSASTYLRPSFSNGMLGSKLTLFSLSNLNETHSVSANGAIVFYISCEIAFLCLIMGAGCVLCMAVFSTNRLRKFSFTFSCISLGLWSKYLPRVPLAVYSFIRRNFSLSLIAQIRCLLV